MMTLLPAGGLRRLRRGVILSAQHSRASPREMPQNQAAATDSTKWRARWSSDSAAPESPADN
ncbi:hypothetical protein [Sphingopyxis kveilinensis]|uniref:hypothetical protein n=1 Tax=Sphingopyxis kveilinensis TaxID=3114367 RepID=UPI0030CB1E89